MNSITENRTCIRMKVMVLIGLMLTGLNGFGQHIDRKAALEDFNQFVDLLERQSSYYQLSDYDFDRRFQTARTSIEQQDSVSVLFLANEMEKIIAETVDRHASVKMEDFDEDEIELFDRHLPFAVAPLQGRVAALKYNKEVRCYEYYSKEYPYIKSIEGLPIMDFIERYAYRRKKAPAAAMFYDGTKDLRDIGELFVKQGQYSLETVDVVLTNGSSDQSLQLALSDKKHRWRNPGHNQDMALVRAAYFGETFDFEKLDRWMEDSIAYLRLPAMFSYEDFPDLEAYLHRLMEKYKHAQALIIDLRGNGGGRRDILHSWSGYIVPADQSPWVANVAYVRSDQQLDEDIESMRGRYLYNYYSEHFTDSDRAAIDAFNADFKTEDSFDRSKFSEAYYMLLKSNGMTLSCPIYVLVDESAFSAASVFASAFKGLPNVNIVGMTTNGSSGRSKKFYLEHSNIRIKLSTMLSFQRNGKTLDGHGTEPDIRIERNEEHILGKSDAQLNKLIQRIKKE